jgi:hypothetical protein
MAFEGKNAVIVGGSGIIGSGIIRVSCLAHALRVTRCSRAFFAETACTLRKTFHTTLQTLLKHGAAVLAPVRSAKGKASLEQDVAGVSTDKLQVMLRALFWLNSTRSCAIPASRWCPT